MSETIISKRCSHCKQIKPISEFHKETAKKDGHHPWCKICRASYDKVRNQTEKGKIINRKSAKKYQQTRKGKETKKRAGAKYWKTEKGKQTQKRYITNNSEKYYARMKVNIAVQGHKLPRPDSLPCYYCQNPAKEYHHWKGYESEHWFDVIPVCKKCHSEHPHIMPPLLNLPAGRRA